MNLKYKEFYKKAGVYKIINKINNKFYIGSSVNLYVRSIAHKSNLVSKNHSNIKLQNAVNKYDIENFEFVVLELVNNKNELRQKELEYINILKPDYNLLKVANNILYHSEESKIKIGIKSKEKFIKNPNLLNIISNNCKKIAGWNKGLKNYLSDKQRKTISENCKKRWENLTDSQKENFIKSIQEGRKIAIEKYKRPVLQYDLNNNFIKEFESLTEATKAFNKSSSGNLHKVLNNGHKLYGYYWKYKQIKN